eukprot:g6638.t1
MEQEQTVDANIEMVGHRKHALGTATYYGILAWSALLMIAFGINLYGRYYDCQFVWPDAVCTFGDFRIMGTYVKTLSAHVYISWTFVLLFGIIIWMREKGSNLFYEECDLDSAEVVFVKKTGKQVVNKSTSTNEEPASFLKPFVRLYYSIFRTTEDTFVLHFENCEVCHRFNSGEKYIIFQCERYIWDGSRFALGQYILGKGDIDAFRTSGSCLSSDEIDDRKNLVGKNVIAYEVESYFSALIDEFMSFRYLYQLYMYSNWVFGNYWHVGGILWSIVVGSALIRVYIKRNAKQKIYNMTRLKSRTTVLRDDKSGEEEWAEIPSIDLVPGDIVKLTHGANDNWDIPADMILMRGNVICNEIGQISSAKRLISNCNIDVKDPNRIALGGKVKTVCFDKTGTITKDGLDYMGFVNTEYAMGKEKNLEWEVGKLSPAISKGLATCHNLAVFGSGVIGPQVEVEMFQATGFEMKVLDNVTFVEKRNEQKLKILEVFKFDHHTMTMSVVVEDLANKNKDVYVKGAPEKLLKLCLPETVPEHTEQQITKYALEGNYVLALATKPFNSAKKGKISRKAVEKDLTFLGLILFRNEMKPTSPGAFERLQHGGIECIMVTGDNAMCGSYIAKACGICDPAKDVLLGDVDALSGKVLWAPLPRNPSSSVVYSTDQIVQKILSDDGNLSSLALTGNAYNLLQDNERYMRPLMENVLVYARMSPDQKQRLVERIMDTGRVVGMVGDGGNDCGALRAAHVGLALTGSDASIVAPFTTTGKSLGAVVDLLLEGRCALANSFASYKFLIIYGQLFCVVKLVGYVYGTFMCTLGYLTVDVIFVIGVTTLMTYAQPKKVFALTTPAASLLSPGTVWSILQFNADRAALMSGFEVTIDVIFMVAFAAKFYTPYVRAEDGVWEVSPGRISRHVLLKADFIILFFCTIPMGLIAVLLGESMPLLIWRFLQVCARYYACIDNKTMINPEKIFKNFSHQIGFLSTLTKSLLLILGFLHWSTCFWYYLHPAEDILMISSANYIAYQKSHEYDQNVLPEAEREVSGHLNNIFDMQVTLYFRFAYETLSIVVGDQVEGTTPRQYAFLYSMTFLGVCMVAGLFGQVGNIIASQNKERMLYLEKMNDSVRTMRYLQLPDTVIERVIRYHEYIYNVFGGFTPNKINQFADQLSMPLRAEVKLHCHTNLISRVALFDKLDANISRYLIDCLKIEIYMPGDYVVREGEYDSSLFMIVKGVCQVFMHGKEKAVATLRQGDYFGEISLVTRQARTATVRAETFCNFAVINKDDYDRIKQAHQDAFSETEKIVMAKLKKYTGLKNEIKRSASNHLGSESESEADKAKSTEVPSPHSSLRGLPPINKGSKEPALHTTSATNNSLSSGLGMVAKLAKKGRKAKRAKTGQLVLDKLDFLIKAVEKNAKGVWLLQQQLEGRETPRK